MPKKYSNSKKEEWLAALAQGKSTKQVAREYNVDERTVKRSAGELYSRRAAQEALTQLYQEAIRGHFGRLNTALDRIINDLRSPDLHQAEIAWSDLNTSRISSDAKGENREEKGMRLGHGVETFSDGTLLVEHLKNVKAWRAFADWKRNGEKYRNNCRQLQIKIIETVSDMTGLAVQINGNGTVPFLDAEVTGSLLWRCLIQHLFDKDDALNLEKELDVDGEHGAVKFRGTIMAEGFRDVRDAYECKTNIMKSLEILKKSQEAQQLLNMFEQIRKTLPKVKNELQAVRIMGVLPGRCRICHQFGL